MGVVYIKKIKLCSTFVISNDNVKNQLKNLFKDNPAWFIEQNQNIIQSFTISKPKKISKTSILCF